mmetsp:Transcript_26642/g.85766  ORF Transcript_26642/g.85766 Transcript_26642/m.85766 type:complete len:268 (+) Transcript_26642:190-993(+)
MASRKAPPRESPELVAAAGAAAGRVAAADVSAADGPGARVASDAAAEVYPVWAASAADDTVVATHSCTLPSGVMPDEMLCCKVRSVGDRMVPPGVRWETIQVPVAVDRVCTLSTEPLRIVGAAAGAGSAIEPDTAVTAGNSTGPAYVGANACVAAVDAWVGLAADDADAPDAAACAEVDASLCCSGSQWDTMRCPLRVRRRRFRAPLVELTPVIWEPREDVLNTDPGAPGERAAHGRAALSSAAAGSLLPPCASPPVGRWRRRGGCW